MAVRNQLLKLFQSFKGLDLRVSDLLRDQNASTGMTNVDFRQTGAITKRKGYQSATETGTGGFGMTTFNNVNIENGSVTEEVITIDDNLHRLETQSFTITYTGTDNERTYYTNFSNSDGDYIFSVYDDGVEVLAYNLGDGNNTGDNINTLISQINGLTNFTCGSLTGGGASPGAFIPVEEKQTLTTSGYDVEFTTLTQIDTPPGLTNPFSTFYSNRTSSEFENATFTQLSDVLFIATGKDNLMKYDGSRVYRAGLPRHTNITSADSATGTTFGSGEVRSYLAVYEYVDAKQNPITGRRSEIDTHTMAGTKDIDVTVTYEQDQDFNTSQAQVNGAQSTVNTITVDDSSELKVGDFVYIDDSVSGGVVSRKITAVPDGTSITVDGDAVTVGDNDYISTIKISLYRTENHSSTPSAPGLFYLVKEFTNNSGGTTETYTDSLADSSLVTNIRWIEPIKDRGLPPKTRYCDEWRGQLILSGDPSQTNRTYYSDIDSPEYFPTTDNSFDVDNKVTGVKSMEDVLYVFKERSISGVDGDFAEDNFRVSSLSRSGIGCRAHHSIQEVQGRLMFLSDQGVYAIDNTGMTEIGSPIEPKFDVGNSYAYKQAVGYNWQRANRYILHMPVTPVDASYSSDADSEVFVYDYFRGSWLRWTNFNLMGGMTSIGNEVYKSPRTSDIVQVHRILQNRSQYDYVDHNQAIMMDYKSQWFTLGEPSVWKKFLRCKLHSYDTAVDDFEGDFFSVTLSTQNDYITAISRGGLVYDFSGGTSGWGSFSWGEFPWGELRLPQLKKKISSQKARSMRIILENDTINENVLISGYTLEIAAPYGYNLKE